MLKNYKIEVYEDNDTRDIYVIDINDDIIHIEIQSKGKNKIKYWGVYGAC